MAQKQTWKRIPGYRFRYMVSDQGNIKCMRSESILEFHISRGGLPQVRLYDDDTSRTYPRNVNRLVCEVFNENTNNYKFIRHKNRDIFDCRAENLEFCMYSRGSSQHYVIQVDYIEGEEWREIKGFTHFLISSMGRVKNTLTNNMVNSFRSCHHFTVTLHDFVGVTNKNVRFLVAEAFMTKPNGFYILYHKSGDVRDNSVENLGWQKGLPRGYMRGAKNAKKARELG